MQFNPVREDSFVLKKLHELFGNFNQKLGINNFHQYPLLIIPPLPMKDQQYMPDLFNPNDMRNTDDLDQSIDWVRFFANNQTDWIQNFQVFESAPEEFLFLHDKHAGTALGRNNAMLYGYCKKEEDFINVSHIELEIATPKEFSVAFCEEHLIYKPILDSNPENGWQMHLQNHNRVFSNPTRQREWQQQEASINAKFKEANGVDFLTYNRRAHLAILGSFLQFAFFEDKYPVQVQSIKKPSKMTERERRKKPWIIRNASRLIYLNSLNEVVEHGQHRTNTGRVQRPHKRRGFWKTLKHPKFKHHPMFEVPKGVYVRPAIVGDKEKIIDNHRYTIITGE